MMRAVVLALALLAGCYAEPLAPNVNESTTFGAPAILFANGCGFLAAFEVSIDGGLSTLTILGTADTMRTPVATGPHAVAYAVLSLTGGGVLNLDGGAVDVRGPTPYPLRCAP